MLLFLAGLLTLPALYVALVLLTILRLALRDTWRAFFGLRLKEDCHWLWWGIVLPRIFASDLKAQAGAWYSGCSREIDYHLIDDDDR